MRHNPLFSIFIIITIICLFTVPFVNASATVYQYYSCDNLSDLAINNGTSTLNSTNRIEGLNAIQVNATSGSGTVTVSRTVTAFGIQHTLSCYGLWFYLSNSHSHPFYMVIFEIYNSSNTHIWYWSITSNSSGLLLQCSVQDSTGTHSSQITTSYFQPNQWNWLEIAYDSGNVIFYRNGTQILLVAGDIVCGSLVYQEYSSTTYGNNLWMVDYFRLADIEEYPPPTGIINDQSGLTYIHTIIPTPNYDLNTEYSLSNAKYAISLNQSITYTYSQEVKNNSVHCNVNGTYYVLSSGTSENWINTFHNDSISLTQVLTGSIINGNFSFNILPRLSDPHYNAIYEVIEVITMLRVNDTLIAVFTERNNVDFLRYNAYVPSTTPSYGNLDLTSWLVLFLIILCPIMILGFIFGKSGLLIGMVYSIGIGVATHLLDPWFIIVIVIALVVELYEMFRGR